MFIVVFLLAFFGLSVAQMGASRKFKQVIQQVFIKKETKAFRVLAHCPPHYFPKGVYISQDELNSHLKSGWRIRSSIPSHVIKRRNYLVCQYSDVVLERGWF